MCTFESTNKVLAGYLQGGIHREHLQGKCMVRDTVRVLTEYLRECTCYFQMYIRFTGNHKVRTGYLGGTTTVPTGYLLEYIQGSYTSTYRGTYNILIRVHSEYQQSNCRVYTK